MVLGFAIRQVSPFSRPGLVEIAASAGRMLLCGCAFPRWMKYRRDGALGRRTAKYLRDFVLPQQYFLRLRSLLLLYPRSSFWLSGPEKNVLSYLTVYPQLPRLTRPACSRLVVEPIRQQRGNAMRLQIAALSIALLLPLQLFARSKTDVIVMNNGDHLTCEIKGLDQGTLSVSFDYIKGTTSVDWSKVHHLESKQLFIVKAEDGSVYVGMIRAIDSAAGRPMQIIPSDAPEEMVEVKHAYVIDLTQTSANFWQRFNGSLNSGINYAKGNNSTQYNLSANVDYPRE